MGSRLGRSVPREPAAGDGPHLGVRSDGPYPGAAGLRRIAAASGRLSATCPGYPDRPPVTPGDADDSRLPGGRDGRLRGAGRHRGRRQHGRGQMVDVGLYEPMLRMMDELIPCTARPAESASASARRTEYVVPHNHYQRAGRSLDRDRVYQRPDVRASGHGAMSAAGAGARVPHHGLAPRPPRGAGRARAGMGRRRRRRRRAGPPRAAEVPCGPVDERAGSVRRSSTCARARTSSRCPTPLGGLLAMSASSPARGHARPHDTAGPVEVGAHNEEIYCGRLGLTRDEVQALAHRGVI